MSFRARFILITRANRISRAKLLAQRVAAARRHEDLRCRTSTWNAGVRNSSLTFGFGSVTLSGESATFGARPSTSCF